MTRILTAAFSLFALVSALTFAAAGSEHVSFVEAGFGNATPAG